MLLRTFCNHLPLYIVQILQQYIAEPVVEVILHKPLTPSLLWNPDACQTNKNTLSVLSCSTTVCLIGRPVNQPSPLLLPTFVPPSLQSLICRRRNETEMKDLRHNESDERCRETGAAIGEGGHWRRIPFCHWFESSRVKLWCFLYSTFLNALSIASRLHFFL